MSEWKLMGALLACVWCFLSFFCCEYVQRMKFIIFAFIFSASFLSAAWKLIENRRRSFEIESTKRLCRLSLFG